MARTPLKDPLIACLAPRDLGAPLVPHLALCALLEPRVLMGCHLPAARALPMLVLIASLVLTTLPKALPIVLIAARELTVTQMVSPLSRTVQLELKELTILLPPKEPASLLPVLIALKDLGAALEQWIALDAMLVKKVSTA